MALKLYEPSKEDDLILAQWYAQLMESGDMDLTFMPDLHKLSNFLNTFRPPAELTFNEDSHGIFLAAWLTPMLPNVASFGAWIRQDKRHSQDAVQELLHIYTVAFEHVEVLISFTKQGHLIELLTKLGYELLLEVPKMWADSDGWILALTKEAFYGQERRRLGRLEGARGHQQTGT